MSPFSDSLSLRLRTLLLVLNLAININSLDRSTKSTISRLYSILSVCKHRVSVSISLPSRGSFRLSLTVLISIGHQVVFSLMGWSPLIHARFHVSYITLDPTLSSTFSYTGLSPSSVCFPKQFH